MGIKSLSKFLHTKYPDIYIPTHLSDYAYKKVAIDISLYLCKFKTTCGQHWIAAFINLVVCLRRNEIHCVFIYDNGAPEEKSEERKVRQERQVKLCEKVDTLEESFNNYKSTGHMDQILEKLVDSISARLPVSLLSNKNNSINPSINLNAVEQEIYRQRKQILDLSPEDYALTRKLFDILRVPYYNAVLEAETTCSDLCKRGLVDAVLSEDTDVLAYSTPIFLCKIDTTANTCMSVRHTSLLEMLGLNQDEFLDFCIMCGTDYNKNIPKIGPDKSFKLISQYRNIDSIAKNTTHDISILNHIRTRELFREYKKIEIDNIPYCGTPDFAELESLMSTLDIRLNIDNIKRAFHREIIIDESDTMPE